MAIDLDKQYGPFSLKIWLLIGVGGVGIGLYVASKQNSGSAAEKAGVGAAVSQPGAGVFRVLIGREHVDGAMDMHPSIKPDAVTPIFPSNPATRPIVSPFVPTPGNTRLKDTKPALGLYPLKPIKGGSTPPRAVTIQPVLSQDYLPGYGPGSMNGTYL